jgi:hypothetical protein
MNKENYEKKIVCSKHCWFTCSVDNIQLIISKENYMDWDMNILFNEYSNYVLYNAGYILCKNFSIQVMNDHRFKWLHGEWLPNWGILTKKKKLITLSIKRYWITYTLKNILNFPNDINSIIINFIL